MLTHPAKLRLINAGFWAGNGHRTKMSPRNRNVTFAKSQQHVINSTNLSGALHNGVEDWLHVRGRAADNAEHLGRCGLMVEGFSQFHVALLDLFEKADVLDGDDGLRGKGLKQFHLPLAERTDFLPADKERPNRYAFA